ncbi:MAG: alpha/beta hydrolase, partial [Candidatus Rokubacteria bacterium]|nr:alpha/beta hydrolase [Candidatus Rokubacteria bacterium]
VDVYRPGAPAGPAPIVVFFYGGFWKSGSRAEYRFAGYALASRGFVAVVPDYRLYPDVEFPAFVEDAAAAVRWVQAHAAQLGGDPSRIYLMGHSAGAHIAALLTLDERYLRTAGVPANAVRGTIGLAGIYDFLPLADSIRPVFGPTERWPDSQPIRFVDGTEPPMLLLHGTGDRVVSAGNSDRLAMRIRERGGRVESVVYPDASHARLVLALLPFWQHSPPVLEAVASFIRDH